MSDVARLASARAVAKTLDPISTIRRGPKRSDRFPQMMLPKAMARKPKVMALDMPVMDHPVSREMGRRKTGSENIAPIATQPKMPPAATITQRYFNLLMVVTTNGRSDMRHRERKFSQRHPPRLIRDSIDNYLNYIILCQ